MTPDEEQREFVDMLNRFVKGKENGFAVWAAAAKLGASAIPELKKRLEADVNGSNGRAAIIALHKMPPDLALPLIEFALSNSRYGATRYYAAEYLSNNRTEKAKELARTHLPSETDADARLLLDAVVK